MTRTERDIIRDWQSQWGMTWRPDSDDDCMCGCEGRRCRPGSECHASDDCVCGLDGCACVRTAAVAAADPTKFLLADQRKSGLSVRAYEEKHNIFLGLERGFGRAGDIRTKEARLSELSDKLGAGPLDCVD